MPPSISDRDDDTSHLLREETAAANARLSHEIWEDAEAVAKQAKKEEESKSSFYLLMLTLSVGG
jgi:solute carrier family 45 protein 1/2/4